MADDRPALAHLFRRAGFSATAAELDAATSAGYEATVESLLSGGPGADPGVAATPAPQLTQLFARPKKDDPQYDELKKKLATERFTLANWWLSRMVAVKQPLTEKMTFFWHGHWATSIQKVKSPALMQRQIDTLREHALGDFRAMAIAMVNDPALVVWLDGQKNTSKSPNENLARELMELFTLGIGHYSEDDVKQAAKALTGYTVNRETGELTLRRKAHDTGSKTVLDKTGNLDANGLVDVVLNRPDSAPFVLGRIWARMGGPGKPPEDTLQRMQAAYGAKRDLRAAVRAMLLDPAFRDEGNRGSLVKQPVEWVVGAMRVLKVSPDALAKAGGKDGGKEGDKKEDGEDGAKKKEGGKQGGKGGALLGLLNRLGQVPLMPPNVGGWPEGRAWLTTASTQARTQLATALAAAADLGAVESASGAERPDAIARILGVDKWTDGTREALAGAGDPRRMVALALVSPEYVVN